MNTTIIENNDIEMALSKEEQATLRLLLDKVERYHENKISQLAGITKVKMVHDSGEDKYAVEEHLPGKDTLSRDTRKLS